MALARTLGAVRPAFLLAAAAFILPVLLRVPSFFEPHWYGDEGIFAAVAAQLLRGEVLYEGAWDHKPPLIFVLYAGVMGLFGESMAALRGAATIAVLVTQALIYLAVVPLAGPVRAALAALVFGLLMAIPVTEGQLALTEVFMAVLTTAAICLYLRSRWVRPWHQPVPGRHWLAIGVLFGLATAFKQVAALDAAALALFVLLAESRRTQAAALIGVGIALPWLSFLVLFAVLGALPSFVEANLTYQLQYAVSGGRPGTQLAIAAAAPALALAFALLQRPVRSLASLPVLWLGFALAGVLAAGAPYPHYLIQALPPLAVASVLVPSVRPRLLVPAAALAIVVAYTVHSFMGLTSPPSREYVRNYFESFVRSARTGDLEHFQNVFGHGWWGTAAMSEAAGGLDLSGKPLLIWGERAWVYPLSGARPASRFLVSFHVLGDAAREREVLLDLQGRATTLVLLEGSVPLFPGLEELLDLHYGCREEVGFAVCEPALPPDADDRLD
jgi:4-amino-4-deoxy-L-arabinose transferase-like glycosyltransferase